MTSAESGPVGALLMTWMLLVTLRSELPDGRLARTGPLAPARRMASAVEPPPSRLIALTAPRDSISSASSGRRMPTLQPDRPPSTVARIKRPSAVRPTALRAWSWSALAGRGEMLGAPSRTIHSRPLMACWIDSQPAVTDVVSVTDSPGARAASGEGAWGGGGTGPGAV